MKKRKSRILVLFLAVLLVSVMSCENPFLKKMLVEEEKGKTVPEKPHAPFVEGGASLILSPDKLTIKVKAVTSDGSAVAVEGCTETTLASSNSTYTVLHAKGTVVILKGNIIELNFYNNQLTALNVQGLSALKKLFCHYNQLTALNVQGLTALKELYCGINQLTAIDVQGRTALKRLWCNHNQLTELNVQGLTALQELWCNHNQLTELNVQGLTALKELDCCNNQLNADAFKKLFDDLPARAEGNNAECVLYTEKAGVTEGNHTDFTTPQDLKDAFDNAKHNKKWKMYKRDGSWPGVEI
ncbi:leucine-rich repeat domain-containing protein [Treponema denticola]